MLRLSISLLAVLGFSCVAIAQQNPTESGTASVQPASETCAFTFSSGTGHGVTQYCVTENGNIAQFSAVGGNGLPWEFLNGVNPAIEGYGLCDTTSAPLKAYWDYAANAGGNWKAATATANDTTVTVTRTTADGVWQLVQTITELKGSAKLYGAAKIAMAITNLSKNDRFLIVDRYANIDAGSSTFNDFDLTQTTVFGLVPAGNGPGLSSTVSFVTTPFDFSIAFVNKVPRGPIPCQAHPNFTTSFFEGDGGIDQEFNLEIGPGKTKTVVLTYKPI